MKTGNKILDNLEIYQSDTLAKNKERIKNRDMLRESRKIALKVLIKLDEIKMSKRQLAEQMNVTPQQISKIVSGKENLTIETQIKLQKILDIPILASYYEKKDIPVISLEPFNTDYLPENPNYVNGHYSSFNQITTAPLTVSRNDMSHLIENAV